MSSPSVRGFLLALIAIISALAVHVHAKPSHPFAYHGVPDHFDALPAPPPLYPAPHFHSFAAPPPPPPPPPPPAFLPAPVAAPLPLAAPAPVFAPAPLPPAPLHATYFAAPAPVFAPAPAPLPPPVFAPAPVALPPPVHLTKILPPVIEALPFAVAAPTYRAIPGPKTTTHHVSVGYAFPAPAVAKFVAQPVGHSHLAAAPLSLGHYHHSHHKHGYHHSLF